MSIPKPWLRIQEQRHLALMETLWRKGLLDLMAKGCWSQISITIANLGMSRFVQGCVWVHGLIICLGKEMEILGILWKGHLEVCLHSRTTPLIVLPNNGCALNDALTL